MSLLPISGRRLWNAMLNQPFVGRRRPRPRRGRRPGLEALEHRLAPAGAAPYVVTNSADDGSPGTLRFGINQVDQGIVSEIDFAIGQQGTATTIALGSALPAIA